MRRGRGRESGGRGVANSTQQQCQGLLNTGVCQV